ncbi:SDR family NAD(P)-dependent oxidoreductase [Candidatus Woesearchaeota archaeon]|nr:SDR family NAD(P)-dependent oxidoreductase [Candidatus Woesearchaeota archaeon]
MATYSILVTGGAGFIGSFVVDRLIEEGHRVKILDNLEPQVHQSKIPQYLNRKAEFLKGDVLRDADLKKALEDIEVVFHLAARVGIGQSMYQIKEYVETNTFGTAKLLDMLVNGKHDIKKLVVASSMSIYGEGSYHCERCGEVEAHLRTEERLKKQDWEMHCPGCGGIVQPMPTKETKTLVPSSIYAITKQDQEQMCLVTGKAYGIPTVALRFFNVYGPRQSLSNPYTGVAAIFMSRIKNDNLPLIFEDGKQSRDFTSVHDIAAASILAMRSKSASYEALNVGTGNPITVQQVAEILMKLFGKTMKPEIVGKYRKGDIRHCVADISKIKDILGFEPRVSLEAGMKELIQWAEKEEAEDKVAAATQELKAKGLV